MPSKGLFDSVLVTKTLKRKPKKNAGHVIAADVVKVFASKKLVMKQTWKHRVQVMLTRATLSATTKRPVCFTIFNGMKISGVRISRLPQLEIA